MLTFDKNKILGKGSFGTVFSGLLDGMPVAVKQINLRCNQYGSLESLETEVKIHKKLNHQNIIKLLISVYGGDYLYLGLELMESGDLYDILYTKNLPLTASVCVTIAQDVVAGLTYLHEQGFLHRDIKIENIVFTANMRAKIADFGLAIPENEAQTNELVGSKISIAPELALAYLNSVGIYNYNRLTDVYALGITLLEMMCRDHPYGKPQARLSYQDIAAGDHCEIPKKTPYVLADVITGCLIKSVIDRMDTHSLLQLFSIDSFEFEKLILNDSWRALKYSQLHWAARQGDAERCWQLLNHGVDPSLKNYQGKMAEELWPADAKEKNPFLLLRKDLYSLAKQDSTLPKDRQEVLMTLIFTLNTHLLTWDIHWDENIENFINHVFAYNNATCITRLMTHDQWPRLSQTRTSAGLTLLHYMAYYDQLRMDKYLEKIAVNDISNAKKRSALHFAALGASAAACIVLLERGADPLLKDSQGNLAEELWPADATEKNPFILLQEDLHRLAKQDLTLSQDRQDVLMTLIFSKHTCLLTYELGRYADFNFITEVICHNNEKCFTRLITHEKWPSLAQTRTKSGYTLLHYMTYYKTFDRIGIDSLLSIIDSNDTSNITKSSPLHWAARQGDAEWCWQLLNRGANVNLRNTDGQTAEDLWPADAQQINPFNMVCRVQHLAQKKEKIICLLDAKSVGSWIATIAFFIHQPMMHELYQRVHQANFKPEDDSSQTADALLNDIIDDWEHRHPEIHARNRYCFFSQINIFSAHIENTLDDIKRVYA